MIDIDDSMLKNLETADVEGFVRLGMEYADAVVSMNDDLKEELDKLFKSVATEEDKVIDTIDDTEDFSESYYKLYNELVG